MGTQHSLIDVGLSAPASPLPKSPRRNVRSTCFEQDSLDQQIPCDAFLKFPGRKGVLAPRLAAMMPRTYGMWHEPFVGAGGFTFHHRPRKAWLSDANAELINCYERIQLDIEPIMAFLEQWRYPDDYAAISKADLSRMTRDARAARLIYLQWTCFNGLYRVNKNGIHNVPIGRYEHPSYANRERLMKCHLALQPADKILFSCGDFRESEARVAPGDFFYADSPYPGGFVAYTKDGFTKQDHVGLAAIFRRLSEKGAYCLSSNADTDLVRELYDGFEMVRVERTGAINSDPEKRQAVTELIIRGWK